jgi:signal transduction histidine kinase
MTSDPFAELKRAVLDRLHHRPSGTRTEIDQEIRQTLQEVLATVETRVSARDRVRIANELHDGLDA